MYRRYHVGSFYSLCGGLIWRTFFWMIRHEICLWKLGVTQHSIYVTTWPISISIFFLVPRVWVQTRRNSFKRKYATATVMCSAPIFQIRFYNCGFVVCHFLYSRVTLCAFGAFDSWVMKMMPPHVIFLGNLTDCEQVFICHQVSPSLSLR